MTTAQRISSVDRRQQILGVATELFAEKGFGGTTTREIAAHAQVNEALIFRHFPTKEELYWAVLEAKVRSEDSHLRLEELLAGAADVREALVAVAEWTLQRRAEDHATTRLSLFCVLSGTSCRSVFLAASSPNTLRSWPTTCAGRCAWESCVPPTRSWPPALLSAPSSTTRSSRSLCSGPERRNRRRGDRCARGEPPDGLHLA